LTLAGPRVRLVPVAPEHRERLRELRLEPEVLRWWHDLEDDWPAPERDTVSYTVMLDGEIAGFAQWWEEPEPAFRHAGIDVFLDPAVHGRGLGTETVRALCGHLIDDKGFHRLVIDPEVENEVAIACYRKVGFRSVGVMRRYERDRSGVWKDGLLMDLLADEFVRG
jgi:aminoglycoside 6'-N-acetyltransferase